MPHIATLLLIYLLLKQTTQLLKVLKKVLKELVELFKNI
jgi:hypothetical protein